MKKCIFPGSFDVITNAHLDIIKRAVAIFDEVVVAILINPDKKCMFSDSERVRFCELAVGGIKNVTVITFSGLLVDLCNALNIKVVVRGMRNAIDFDYEMTYALSNFAIDDSVEIIWLPTKSEFSFISSSLVRELILGGKSPSDFVPSAVVEELQKNKF